MGAKIAALFTSVTIRVNVDVSLSLGDLLSATRTVITLVLGPCASEGVHVNNPFVALIDASAGAPASRLKLSVCAGMSGSVAAAVNEISVPSGAVRLVMAVRTGGLLDSSTMI